MYIMPTMHGFAVVPCNYSTTFTKQNNDTMPKPGNKQLQKRRNDKYKNNKIIIYPL